MAALRSLARTRELWNSISSSCPSLPKALSEQGEEPAVKILVNDVTPSSSQEHIQIRRNRSWNDLPTRSKQEDGGVPKPPLAKSWSLSSAESDVEEPVVFEAVTGRRSPLREKQRSFSDPNPGHGEAPAPPDTPQAAPVAGSKSSSGSSSDSTWLLTATTTPRHRPTLTLQKSISTPSIPTAQGDLPEEDGASLAPKSSGYTEEDKSIKRRKKGSLFFRKKRSKEKSGSQPTPSKRSSHQFVSVCCSTAAVCDHCSKPLANKLALRCEGCLITIHETSCQNHVASECSPVPRSPKVPPRSIPISKSPVPAGSKSPTSRSKKSSSKSSSWSTQSCSSGETSPKTVSCASALRRPYSGYSQWRRVATKLGVNRVINEEREMLEESSSSLNMFEASSNSMESLDEGDLSDMDEDSLLRLADEEPDSWNSTVEKKMLKKLKEKEVKKQEAIYETILTEKHHCLTLKVMQKVFARGMMRELQMSKELVERIFPCLEELLDLHTGFLSRLRERQSGHQIVDSIGDLLLLQFRGENAARLRYAYSQFCGHHKDALSLYKDILKSDRKFQDFIKRCSQKPLCKKRGIPESILLVTQRITKYPLLIERMIKVSKDDRKNLEESLDSIKDIIGYVNEKVALKEKEQRLLDIYHKIDAKSTAYLRGSKFKKSDLLSNGRRLLHEGPLWWKSARGKCLEVITVMLTDVIIFLQESNQKYFFVSVDSKSATLSLHQLLVREKAGQDNLGLYLISPHPSAPEMYELTCPTPRDKKVWVDLIREAVERCPLGDEPTSGDSVTKELNSKSSKFQVLVATLREKDMAIARLCEEKSKVFADILELHGLEPSYQHRGDYRDLIGQVDDAKTTMLTSLTEASRILQSIYQTSRRSDTPPSSRKRSGDAQEPAGQVYFYEALTATPLLTSQGRDQLDQVVALNHFLNVLMTLLNRHFSHMECLRVQLTEATDRLAQMTGSPKFSRSHPGDNTPNFYPDRSRQEQLRREQEAYQRDSLFRKLSQLQFQQQQQGTPPNPRRVLPNGLSVLSVPASQRRSWQDLPINQVPAPVRPRSTASSPTHFGSSPSILH